MKWLILFRMVLRCISLNIIDLVALRIRSMTEPIRVTNPYIDNFGKDEILNLVCVDIFNSYVSSLSLLLI